MGTNKEKINTYQYRKYSYKSHELVDHAAAQQ